MALLSRALNFPIAVRPPKANREWITRLLDAGVWNLHCPQVENAAHAAEIVAASRYAPRGLRGNAGHSPGTDYDMSGTAADRRAFANRQVFVTVMLETAAAFDDLDAIAAMDGIDALTIGPADLAQDLGVFGTPDQARVLDEKRDLVLAAAKKHGKTCAMLCSSYEQAQQWKEAGALLLAYSSDSEVLHGAIERGDRQDQGMSYTSRPPGCMTRTSVRSRQTAILTQRNLLPAERSIPARSGRRSRCCRRRIGPAAVCVPWALIRRRQTALAGGFALIHCRPPFKPCRPREGLLRNVSGAD